ncbi:MAG TPA: TIGR01777 family oxidoreductase [Pyrinomonadaceae bacterium]|nr:TIGR01777 family oxidoreductase [Pyrinomonadaceae bacterium]
MKIVIPGGSGHLGTLLASSFHESGHEVVVLSRAPRKSPWRTVRWDGENLGEWVQEFEGADAIINLAGQSVNCRYTQENRKIITDSRIKSTNIVGKAIAQAWNPPRVWLQASTATIYAHTFGSPHDEATGIIGGAEPNAPDTWRFSIDVATSWERAMRESATPNTRRVAMRTAIVMHATPGAPFDILLRLVRYGLGGQAGDGRQYMSWIHERDFVNAVMWLIEHETLEGPVNLASPNPLTNAEFMRVLRSACGVSLGLPAAEWMLELGAFIMGSETELILKSRRVVPAKLLKSGFTFAFPKWSDAARDLCQSYRNSAKANRLAI